MILNYVKYFISVTTWQFFNPFGYYKTFLQQYGQIISILRSLHREVPKDITSMSLPFEGNWNVANGGTTKATSHSWNLIAQRYAYDFIFSEDGNKRYRTNGKMAIDYDAFDRNILAPCDGVIVEVQNKVKDYKYAGTGWIDFWTRDVRGNYIVIKHSDNVYSLTAHLRQNSCTVNEGDKVRRGQVIAKCGNSGHSTEPHIHFQVQDRASFYFSKGLPILFVGIAINNNDKKTETTVEQGYISRNDVVSNTHSNGRIHNEIKIDSTLSNDWIIYLIRSTILAVGLIIGYGLIWFRVIKSLIKLCRLFVG